MHEIGREKGRLSLLIIQLDDPCVDSSENVSCKIKSFACVSIAILVKLNETSLENEVLKLKTWISHRTMFVSEEVSERLGKST
jgi:hypothetical protein